MFSVRRHLCTLLPALVLSAATLEPSAALAQRPNRVPPPSSLPTVPGALATPAAAPSTIHAGPYRPNDPSTPEGQEPVRVQFLNAQVGDVLKDYEAWTHKHVLIDQTVQGQINLFINDPVPKWVGIRIVETQLNLNGFSLIPADPDIIKVIGQGKQVKSAGPPLFTDLASIPEGEQSVSYMLRLRYLDPSETTNQIGQYLLPTAQNGFTPLPKAGAIIITETASNVRKLVNLITSLDNPSAPVVEKFLDLKRADATKAVEFLNSVFETKSSGSTPGQPGVASNPGVAGNNRRTIRRINEDGQPVIDPAAGLPNQAQLASGLIALSGDSIIQGRITLTPEVRTNRIHVVTSPVNMPLVEKLVADYDANIPFASPVRRSLRFVNARDVLPILIQALSEPGSDNNNTNPTNGASNPARPTQTNNNNSNNSLFGNNNNNSSSSGGFGSGSSGGDSGFGNSELNTEQVDTTPTEATVGTTKIIADPRSNTIILLGSAEAKDKVFKVLDQLDVRAPQVVIRVVIGELSIGNNTEFGLNYLLRRNKGALISQFNNGFVTTATPSSTVAADGSTTATALNSATSLLSNLSTAAAGVSSSFSGVGGIISVTRSLDVILTALESTSRFKVVNRPVLFTSNNKKAIIVSGQEIAVPTQSLSSVTTSSNAGVATNVEFKTVALQLEVVPLINSDREVTLDIVQKLDSLTGSNVVVGGNAIPTIAKRQLKSSVSAPNGATVVLGGLITVNDQQASGNVPYLSRIPVIGDIFFKQKTRNLNRSELIILLQPTVTNTPEELEVVRREEDRHMYLEHDLDAQVIPPTPTPVKIKTVKTTVTKTTATVKPLVTPIPK